LADEEFGLWQMKTGPGPNDQAIYDDLHELWAWRMGLEPLPEDAGHDALRDYLEMERDKARSVFSDSLPKDQVDLLMVSYENIDVRIKAVEVFDSGLPIEEK
jgi:hypothetical protein